ncbi:hypothetical protein MTO96_048375 [Rhipicephalus appendiculatus]
MVAGSEAPAESRNRKTKSRSSLNRYGGRSLIYDEGAPKVRAAASSKGPQFLPLMHHGIKVTAPRWERRRRFAASRKRRFDCECAEDGEILEFNWTLDFTSDFYFRQSWRDERLSFQKSPDLESMTVGAEVAEKIWVPDTFFANEKSAYFHAATTPNTFLRIGSGGEVFRSIRLTVTASCPMDLRYFPMDRQACTIEIESFGYTMKDIRYRWSDGDTSVRIAKEVELPQFKVLGHVQKAKEVALTTGKCQSQAGSTLHTH